MKRIFSVICIIFILGVTTAVPFYGSSYFVYAEESNPVLPAEEIIDFGMSTYLNTKNGFLIASQGGVDAVKSVMKAYRQAYYLIDNNHFTDDTLAGYMLVKYNPLRIELKGTAVRFFNDLYDYLLESGKLPNATNSNGGNTTDNLYYGKMIDDSLFYIYNSDDCVTVKSQKILYEDKLLAKGSTVDGVDGNYVKNLFMAQNSYMDWNVVSQNGSEVKVPFSIQFSQNLNINLKTDRYLSFYNYAGDYLMPNIRSLYNNSEIKEGWWYCTRVHQAIGIASWYIDRKYPNTLNYGVVTYDITEGAYIFYKWGEYYYSNAPGTYTDASVDFETEDLDKEPTPEPTGDDVIEYVPKDKDTGDTYNTYNEYINRYIIKKTYITNNEPEPTPGGTVPDWSGGGGSGTITPDGNGGYTFELPDFSLPDLDIDWSISGLTEKFPFSIPFDLLAFFTVLNAEPETPAIEATIPLGLWEWEIDWDLHNFDTLAALLRNLEFIGFCIGLALITRNIIKG